MSQQINYDENGNIINEPSLSGIFTRILLQSVSDIFENALNNLANQIQTQISQIKTPIVNQLPIFLYKNMPNKKENISCPICLDEYKDESMIVITECIHFFHEKCLKEWVDKSHSTCPICRTNLK